MLVANTRKPFRLDKLGSSLGGLCTGRTCSSPQPKHLSVVSSVGQVMCEIPSSAWGRFGPNDRIRGRLKCWVVYTKKIIKVQITKGVVELVKVYISFKYKNVLTIVEIIFLLLRLYYCC